MRGLGRFRTHHHSVTTPLELGVLVIWHIACFEVWIFYRKSIDEINVKIPLKIMKLKKFSFLFFKSNSYTARFERFVVWFWSLTYLPSKSIGFSGFPDLLLGLHATTGLCDPTNAFGHHSYIYITLCHSLNPVKNSRKYVGSDFI